MAILVSPQELASSLWQGPGIGNTKHNSFVKLTPEDILDPNLPKPAAGGTLCTEPSR